MNLRTLEPGTFGLFDLVVADLSFISMRTVLDALIGVSSRARISCSS